MINLDTVDIFRDEFGRTVDRGWTNARLETLAAGVPVFYIETSTGLNVMEQPDGRKFEIRFLPNRPAAENYEIIRELIALAA